VPESNERDVIFEKTRFDLSDAEIGYLQSKFPETAKLVRQRQFKGQYLSLVLQIRNAIKTSTKFVLKTNGCQFLFDGPIYGSHGQGDTAFQFAIKDASIYCAKIGARRTLEHEKKIADMLGDECPTIMPVVALVDVPSKEIFDRVALISPYYPACLSQVIGEMSENQLLNIAICAVSSIIFFCSKGLCHGDIKPSNLMFANNSNLIVLIDYGSAGKFYEVASGGNTERYGLDSEFGADKYDQICLSATLAELKWGIDVLTHIHTVEQLKSYVEIQNTGDATSALIIKLLNEPLTDARLYLLTLDHPSKYLL
jgi:serine/threonine protein kinase